MGYIVNKNLNAAFEILGLLYLRQHPEFMQKEYMMKSAEEFGINGGELYKKFGTVHKKYVATFQKKAILDESDHFFFEDNDESFILLFQIIFATHNQWMKGMNEITDEAVVLTILNILLDDKIESNPDFSRMIEIIQSAGMPSELCWKLVLLLQEPKTKMIQLAGIIDKNIPAYEQALLAIDKPLQKQLTEFPKGHHKIITKTLSENIEVFPTLVYPAAEILAENNSGYVGLYVNEVYKQMKKIKHSRNNLVPMLKAISDNSKFDILESLKYAPKYNMELAEQFGLTAATTSHHMSVLLNYDLVNVEKKDGRVYYTLNRDTVSMLIEEMQYIFLSE